MAVLIGFAQPERDRTGLIRLRDFICDRPARQLEEVCLFRYKADVAKHPCPNSVLRDVLALSRRGRFSMRRVLRRAVPASGEDHQAANSYDG